MLNRWLADHPGLTEVPRSVKVGLQNIKSVLRSKKRGRQRQAALTAAAPSAPAEVQKPKTKPNALELLEGQIDDCIHAATRLEREALQEVVAFLRRARNAVVWQLGE